MEGTKTPCPEPTTSSIQFPPPIPKPNENTAKAPKCNPSSGGGCTAKQEVKTGSASQRMSQETSRSDSAAWVCNQVWGRYLSVPLPTPYGTQPLLHAQSGICAAVVSRIRHELRLIMRGCMAMVMVAAVL